MKDPKTEQFLTHGNWKWEFHKGVPFAEIDMKASRENPSRLLTRLDDDRVQNYGLAMEDGVEFPAIVLLALDPAFSTFKYLIATGVHRTAAAELAGITSFDAYVVSEPDQYRQEVLMRQLNTIEGNGVSIRDRILQILQLHETYPDRSLTALSKEWNIKYSTIKSTALEQAAIKRARGFGFDFTKHNRLSKQSLLAMNGIHADPAFQKLCQYAVLHNVPSNEVEAIAKEIKTTRDEKSALEVIDRHITEAADRKLQAQAKHGRISPAPATKFLSDARRLMNHLDKGIENLHFAAHPRRDLARRLIEDLIESLKRVVGDISRIDRMETPTKAQLQVGHPIGLH